METYGRSFVMAVNPFKFHRSFQRIITMDKLFYFDVANFSHCRAGSGGCIVKFIGFSFIINKVLYLLNFLLLKAVRIDITKQQCLSDCWTRNR